MRRRFAWLLRRLYAGAGGPTCHRRLDICARANIIAIAVDIATAARAFFGICVFVLMTNT